MYKKIGLLEKNQKPKVNVQGGVIYILKVYVKNINTVQKNSCFFQKV